MRHIKNYKKKSKEELLISFLKSEQNIAEFRKSKFNNAEIEEIKKKFKNRRKKISRKTRRTREKTLHQRIKKGLRVF